MEQNKLTIPPDARSPKRAESVLVLEENSPEGVVSSAIARELPYAHVVLVNSTQDFDQALAKEDFDIAVIDYDLTGPKALEMIHRLRLRDYEPVSLVVTKSADTREIAALQHAGCQRCIMKDDNWAEDLPPAVRHALRLRKLEEENRGLLSRLTEANILLDEKNRRLDEFGATVAHDIRGPLAGISMKLDFLLDTYKGSFDERVRTLLERALASSARLTDMVQAMYSYARLGKAAAKMEYIELNPLVEAAVADLNLDQSRDIQIGIDELPRIWGNPDLLRRVFINLIGNAVKYNDKQKIVINIGNAGQVPGLVSQYCAIYVEDDGRGMTKEEMKDIFALFSRGDQSAKGTQGEGIGLAVVQRIVDLHYGKVWVDSTPGQGTRFTFTLPTEEIGYLR